MLKIAMIVIGLAIPPIVHVAAQPSPVGAAATAAHRKAPAPLLAAGIPAFIALGGGGGVVWLVRRVRRGKRAPVAAE
jgi:hypothetical protein